MAAAGFLGADSDVLGGRVTSACARAATRADQIATSLRSTADNRCPVFGPNGETLAKLLRELADGLADGMSRLATFQATAQRSAGEQDKASSVQSAGTQYGPGEVPEKDWMGDSPWDEVVAVLQIAGGIAEVAVGVATIKAVVGIVPLLHGIDNIAAGINTLTNPDDEIKETFTGQFIREKAIENGYSPNEARWISIGGELAIGLGSGLAAKVARGLTVGSATIDDVARGLGPAGSSADDIARSADDIARGVGNTGEISGPWMQGMKNVQYGDDVVAQTKPNSCVSAVGEMLTGGSVGEGQLVAAIGEDVPVTRLISALDDATGGRNYAGMWFDNPSQALQAAEAGPMAAQIQAPFTKAHSVFIEPLGNGLFRVRDPGPAGGAVYDVGAAWVRQYVAGGVWRK